MGKRSSRPGSIERSRNLRTPFVAELYRRGKPFEGTVDDLRGLFASIGFGDVSNNAIKRLVHELHVLGGLTSFKAPGQASNTGGRPMYRFKLSDPAANGYAMWQRIQHGRELTLAM